MIIHSLYETNDIEFLSSMKLTNGGKPLGFNLNDSNHLLEIGSSIV